MEPAATVSAMSSGYSYFRGFIVGMGFLFLIEVIAVLAACFFLFDPLRKTVTPPPSQFASSDGAVPAPGQPSEPGSPSPSTPTSSALTAKDQQKASIAGSLPGGPRAGGTVISATNRRATDRTNEHEEPWPENIVAFLRTNLAPAEGDVPLPPPPVAKPPTKKGAAPVAPGAPVDGEEPPPVLDPSAMGPTIVCDWVNVVVHRFFLSLRDSELFKDRMRARTTERMNMKLQNNSFVSHVNILDLSLGEHAPVIHGIRLLKGVTEDLAVFLEVDVTYKGGGSVAIETTLTAGLSIPVRVYLSGFKGKVRVRIPAPFWPDMLAVSFVEDPGITFIVDSPLTVRDNELVRGIVNKLIAGVMRKVFIEQWVLPSWRYFFMPLMIPSPQEEMHRMNIANSKNPPGVLKRGQTMASRAATLWESRSPLLRSTMTAASGLTAAVKGNTFLDVVGSRSFPTTAMVRSATNLDGFEESVLAPFLAMANESEAVVAEGADGAAVGPDGEGAAVVSGWKTVKNRNGVHVQKNRHMMGALMGEVTRGIITISCDAERVFAFLSNPEHYRFIEDGYTYADSFLMKGFDETRSIRHSSFNLTKNSTKDYIVFEIKKRLSAPALVEGEKDKGESIPSPDVFVVVMRSVAGYSEDSMADLTDLKASDGESSVINGALSTTPTITSASPGSTLPKRLTRRPSADSIPAIATSDALSVPSSTPPASSTLHSAPSSPARNAQPALPSTPSSPPPPQSPSNSNISLVYLSGYLIESNPADPGTCIVTAISQMSPDLAKLEVNFSVCRKIKTVIEEIVSRTGPNGISSSATFSSGNSELRRRKIFGSASNMSGQGSLENLGEKRIDKIKNLVSSGAAYLMKNKKVAGWLGRDGAPHPHEAEAGAKSDIEELAESLAQVEMDRLDELESDDIGGGGMASELDEPVDGEDSADVEAFGRKGGREGLDSVSINEDAPPRIPRRTTSKAAAIDDDAASIAPSVAPSVAPSMVANLTGMVPDNLKEKAAAIARSVTKRRSFSFLKRGGGGGGGTTGQHSDAEDDEDDVSRHGPPTPIDGSFAVGANLEAEAMVERRLAGREIARVEVPFRRHAGSHPELTELAWEFVIKGGEAQGVLFGLVFKPVDKYASFPGDLSIMFPESAVENGDRQLLPMGTIHSAMPGKSFRGSLCLASFPSGVFTFLWDNSGNHKKSKDIWYKTVVRPFEIPRAPSASSSMILGENVGEFGLGTKARGYCTGVMGDVLVQRKSVYRVSVVYDPVMDCTDGENQTVTYLTWDYGTNGLDVMFGITYTKMDSGKAPADVALESSFAKLPHAEPATVEEETDSSASSIVPSNAETLVATASASDGNQNEDAYSLIEKPVDGEDEVDAAPMLPPRKPPRAPSSASVGSATTPPKPPRRGQPSNTSGSSAADRPSLADRLAGVVASREGETPAAPAVGAPSNPIPIPPRPTASSQPQATTPENPLPRTVPTTPARPVPPSPISAASPPPPPSLAAHGSVRSSFQRHARAEVIVPSTRASSHRGSTLSGVIPITGRRGVYSFVWDNSHSVVLHKNISFRVGTVTHSAGMFGSSASAESFVSGARGVGGRQAGVGLGGDDDVSVISGYGSGEAVHFGGTEVEGNDALAAELRDVTPVEAQGAEADTMTEAEDFVASEPLIGLNADEHSVENISTETNVGNLIDI